MCRYRLSSLYDRCMRVRAPGSSANLGPGFDVLGLAVFRHVWVSDTGSGEPCRPDHIARVAYERAGGNGPIWFESELEPGRGLGFSAAARAAGAVLAFLQAGYALEQAQCRAYPLVAALEGHGDNAAPSVFGGLQVIAGDRAFRVEQSLPGRLLFWIPDLETATDQSRSGLPTVISRADAVFNLGRMGLLMAAVYEQRLDLLRLATQDRLHQPERLARCDPAAEAYESALQAGAAAAWLSGSGPTIAVVVDEADRVAVEKVLSETGSVLALDVDHSGAVPDDS